MCGIYCDGGVCVCGIYCDGGGVCVVYIVMVVVCVCGI